jgi:hypothetical protein
MINLQILKREIELEYLVTGIGSKNPENKIIAADFAWRHNRITAIMVAAGYEVDQLNKLNEDISRALKVEL